MRTWAGALVAAWCGIGTAALAQERPPLVLRDFGSFHVGGREAVISGQPVRDVMLTPGGAPVRLDPNGTYLVEQMYVQYFLP